MSNIFASINLFDPGSVIAPLLFLLMGAIMIVFDLRNRRPRLQRSPWYQRPWIVLGIIQIVSGCMILIFSNVLPFAVPDSLSSIFLIIFLLIIGILGIYAFFLLIRTVLKLSRPYQVLHIGNTVIPENVPIAANPLLLLTRIPLIVETVFLPIILLFTIVPLYNLIVGHQSSFYGWMWIIIIPLFGYWLYRTYLRLRYLQQIEPLRFAQATRERNDGLSASTQPTISTPIMITERIKRTHIGIFALLTLLTMVLATLPMIFSPSFWMFSPLFFFVLILALIAFVASFLPFFIARNTINATENGLSDGSGGFVNWQEARLFACYRLPGLLGGYTTTVIYELSSPSKVVRWNWMRSPQSLLTILGTQLSADVYHQQMQTLCELVMAKTGLPLYDLGQLLEEK